MKKITIRFVNLLLIRLTRLQNSLKTPEESAYVSLSPVDNAENIAEYATALTWALDYRKEKNITNIALTGPYGSGKSSVLRTYQKTYARGDIKFLNISLATFKEADDLTDDSINQAPENELLTRQETQRLIELSILQQIFYHEKASATPDSRFKRINNHSRWYIFLLTLFWTVFAGSVLTWKYGDQSNNLIPGVALSPSTISLFHWLSLVVLSIGVIVGVYKIIRVISRIRLSKLTIQDAEIEIDQSVNKSILNHHMDELLYFFEVTSYNVVVIEDLDRFNQPEIFTKLREINLLLNSSKKIQRPIVFIYAVRDDMFTDKERAKFFDYIIPIIPIINSSNSSQKLIEKKKNHQYSWNADLIDNLSLFINDMRLLHNITNEFYLYQKILSPELDQNKILALLVYKNLFPNDFALLANGEGKLYKALDSKQAYIADLVAKKNSDIRLLESEIKRLDELMIRSVKELRNLYLLVAIENLTGFSHFMVNHSIRSFPDMSSDDYFDYLRNNQVYYQYSSYYNQVSIQHINTTFSEIEKKVDPIRGYTVRLKEIQDWNSKKTNSCRLEIERLEQAKIDARNARIRTLIADKKLEIDVEDENQNNLISLLLSNGYIDEDYVDYISLFYEGSLTKADHRFLLSVKSQKRLPHSYKLHYVGEVIARIHLSDFGNPFVLNYQVVDALLVDHQRYKHEISAIIATITAGTEESILFIEGMVEQSENLEEFMRFLCKKWPEIWDFIDQKSNFTDEKKYKYFKIIMQYADIEDIKSINSSSDLSAYIEKDPAIAIAIPDKAKLLNIIAKLDIHLVKLDRNYLDEHFVKGVYEGNFYRLNHDMVKLMQEHFGEFNQANFDTKNYYSIKMSKATHLISYIDANIDDYVKNIYLRINTNTQEDEAFLIELLNRSDLPLNAKKSIVSQVTTPVSAIKKILNSEVAEQLFSCSHVKGDWANLYFHYRQSDNQLTDGVLKYLGENINLLENKRIDLPEKISDKENFDFFIWALLSAKSLDDAAYDAMLKSIPYSYGGFSIVNLSNAKIKGLIAAKTIRLSSANFRYLKETYGERFHIALIETKPAEFIADLANYAVDGDDLPPLLKSKVLTYEQKKTLLNHVSEAIITSNAETMKLIGLSLFANKPFDASEAMLNNLLEGTILNQTEKIKVFLNQSDRVSTPLITEFLNSLGEPYSNITIRGKRPSLPKNAMVEELAKILKDKRYISSFDVHDDSIRVSTFKTEQ